MRKFYHSFCCSLFISFFLFSFTACSDQSTDRWSRFDLKPLSIIYPDQNSLTNPPFIHWQGLETADRYKVTLTGPGINDQWETEFNFLTPTKGYPQGDYQIVISALDKNGKEIKQSSDFSFTIVKPASNYTPDMNHVAFEKGKLFYPSKELLQSMQSDSSNKDRLLKIVQDGPNDIISNLQEPPLYTDGVWNIDQWREKNEVCFAVRDFLTSRPLVFRLTGDRKYLEESLEILKTVSSWDPTGATGVWENDHCAQSLLLSLSISYNLLHDELTAEERAQVARAIRLRAIDMYGFQNPFLPKELSAGLMNNPDNNHPWFCTAALGFAGLALMGEDPAAETWIAFSAQMFNGVYLPRGGQDGEWHEGIAYWSYTLYFVFQFADALDATTGIDLYQNPWLQNTALFKVYTHPPEGGSVPFGDSRKTSPNGFDKLVMMRLASRNNDPLAQAYVDAIPEKVGYGFLFDALQWEGTSQAINVDTIHFPFAYHFKDIGWVVSNNSVFNATDQILFAFRCGAVLGNGGHNHADQNHFIVNAGGDALICDSGYYDWHGSPHHRQYAIQSMAHNTILVDGTGQGIFGDAAPARITKYFQRDHYLMVQGDASNPDIYHGMLNKFIRTIRYENEKSFQVKDDIEAPEPKQISWLLHSAFPIHLDEKTGKISIEGKFYRLEGTFKTQIPVEAFFSEGFPVAPSKPKPTQYHLELKTQEKIEKWKPEFDFEVIRKKGD